MLTYPLEDAGKTPLYEYIYKRIKADIIGGKIGAGAKLPSKRAFAKNLGVSVITVESAYGQLCDEGYVYSMPKRGFYVASLNGVAAKKKIQAGSENVKLTGGGQKLIADFSSNQTEQGQFPFSIWAKITRSILKEKRTELLTNPPVGGMTVLREAIAAHLSDFRGMSVSPSQIIVGAGTEYLYGLLIQLLGKDLRYGVENPGYSKIAKIYKSNGLDCSSICVGADGIDMEELAKKRVDVMHISPSHQFPTGCVTSISRRYELLAWAAKNKRRFIIEDEYDSEFRMRGKLIPTLQSIDSQGKVIYMNTFTKSLASTVRISYMVLPQKLADEFYKRLNFYSCTVSNLEQIVLAKFISDGYFEKHLNRMRNLCKKKRDFLTARINGGPLGPVCKIMNEDAGLHFLLKIDMNLSDSEFVSALEREGVRIRALNDYYVTRQEQADHIFVVNYSSLSEEQIERAVACVEKLVGLRQGLRG